MFADGVWRLMLFEESGASDVGAAGRRELMSFYEAWCHHNKLFVLATLWQSG